MTAFGVASLVNPFAGEGAGDARELWENFIDWMLK
jgi:hypothetical protein